MPKGFFNLPVPKNEPVFSYAPGSPERESLTQAIKSARSTTIEIPMVIGGKEVKGERKVAIRPPHDHQHTLGYFFEGDVKHVTQAIKAALQARAEWAALGWEQRASIFLKAADLLAGPWRYKINAATMLGQSKNAFQAEIDSALQGKAAWILRKLQEQGERLQRLAARRIDWRDGASLPFLGDTVHLALDPRVTGAVLDVGAAAPRLTLRVGLPPQAEPGQIRDVVQSWLQRQARRVFEERCRHFAPQLGVQVRRLSLSSAQTRWGSASASANGAIRLNWRLIHFAQATIDYVVAHELAHLRVMDHSPRFWDVVRSVLPDYERARGELRDEALPVLD